MIFVSGAVRSLIVTGVAGVLGASLLTPLAPAATAVEPNVDQRSAEIGADAGAAARPKVVNRRLPAITGVPRYTRTLRASPGRWSGKDVRVRYQWFRNKRPIQGATKRRYTVGHQDVGRRLRVQVTAKRPGFARAQKRSRPVRARHRIPVRRVVTYQVETRGRITASMDVFRRQAQQTFDDPRGWRNAGVEFRRVARGGAFSLVLSEASQVTSFSSACSTQWSCRVGRYVVINQMRWLQASPSWNAARGTTLRGYRHMVVNHETGHWLGHGHRGCPGSGPAPVMMQQSKGLGGCRHNPWPLRSELWYR